MATHLGISLQAMKLLIRQWIADEFLEIDNPSRMKRSFRLQPDTNHSSDHSQRRRRNAAMRPSSGSNDPEALWQSLDGWAGRENVEERMIRPGWIDPVVLDLLRERSIAAR